MQQSDEGESRLESKSSPNVFNINPPRPPKKTPQIHSIVSRSQVALSRTEQDPPPAATYLHQRGLQFPELVWRELLNS